MNEPYNQFSKEYNDLYVQNIIEFQRNCSSEKDSQKKYVDFYPSFGIKPGVHCDFLVYGQAVNGWGSGFTLETPVERLKLEESIKYSNDYINDHCPLDWVNVYWSKSTLKENTKDESMKAFYPNIGYTSCTSFFWNVVYKLINKYCNEVDINSWAWAKKLVWSNLYKIAPERANPDEEEKLAQLETSIKLVEREIEELKPKYVIVLTNDSWWKPFRESLKTKTLEKPTSLDKIESYEQYKETWIVVTTRPMAGNSDKHVEQILQLIK